MNFVDVVTRQARLRPEAPAIIEGARTLTYREADLLIGQLAAAIASLGIGAGDRVGLCLKDRAEFLLLFLALAKTGTVSVPMDWRAGLHAKGRTASEIGAAVVIREPDAPNLPGIACLGVDELLEAARAATSPLQHSASGGGLLQTIFRSSGTTGVPKGMVVTHDQLIARMRWMAPARYAARDDRRFSAAPLVYYAALIRCCEALYCGRTLILYPSLFTAEELIAAIDRYKPDTTFFVPTIVRRLLELAPAQGRLLPQLQNLVIRGSALQPSEKHEIARRIVPNLYDSFGSTGAGCISCLHPSEIALHADSVGRPVRGLSVEIVDEEDRPVMVGKIGRLRCRGPTVISDFDGSARDDDPEFLRDGWYYTSDLVAFDGAGYLHIEGRAADVINRGGATIYAAEIEGVLLSHSAVCEAAVLGYHAGDLGEEAAAFVVLRSPTDPGHLAGHCRARLGPDKMPRRIIIRDNLPKTASGKIRKPDLAALL